MDHLAEQVSREVRAALEQRHDLAIRRAPIESVDTATRTVTARLVTWNDPRPVRDPDGSAYRETFAPGALIPNTKTFVLDEHHGQLIGHMDNHRDDGKGHVADLHIADTAAGRDVMALVNAGSITDVSIEFDQRGGDGEWNATRTAVTRTRAPLHGVAFAFKPAHTAPIMAVREDEPLTITMPDTPMPQPTVTVAPASDEIIAIRGELISMRDELAARGELMTHPLARFRSFVEYANASFDAGASSFGRRDEMLLTRALADQITTNNPGVIPPGWIMEVKGIINKGRPGINGVGGPVGLPASGTDVNWPYFDGNLSTLTGVQATQKTAITSVRVDFKKGTATIKTFAGGSDLSWQLIRRSEPSYLDNYIRLLLYSLMFVTDNDFVDTLYAGGTGTIGAVLVPGTATASQVRAAIFKASVAVYDATGMPASVVLASSDWILAMGALDGLWPSMYGTYNASGTADARTLNINIAGLPVVYEPNLTAGSLIVTNEAAARWAEDGPFTVTMDDVTNLGHNVALWSMGVTELFIPAGVVVIKAA